MTSIRQRFLQIHLFLRYACFFSAQVALHSQIQQLKGGDSLLYHSLKHYNLDPELHWTAGGCIWPVDRTVDCSTDAFGRSPGKSHGFPAVRGGFATPGSYATDPSTDEAERMRCRVENSGAIPLYQLDIILLTDWDSRWPVGKEKVGIVSGSELEKLVVNVLMVTYIP